MRAANEAIHTLLALALHDERVQVELRSVLLPWCSLKAALHTGMECRSSKGLSPTLHRWQHSLRSMPSSASKDALVQYINGVEAIVHGRVHSHCTSRNRWALWACDGKVSPYSGRAASTLWQLHPTTRACCCHVGTVQDMDLIQLTSICRVQAAIRSFLTRRQLKRATQGVIALQRLFRARRQQSRCMRDQSIAVASVKRAQGVAYRERWHAELTARLRLQQYGIMH